MVIQFHYQLITKGLKEVNTFIEYDTRQKPNAAIKKRKNNIINEILQNKVLYLMAVPGMLALFLFNYLPLSGIVIAFKNFNIQDGIFGSPWNGLKNFEFFFIGTDKAFVTTFNTLVLNIMFIGFGLVFQILTAIFINEIGNKYFKKITQSLIFLPYFLSWVVVGAIIYTIFSSNGSINQIITALGFEKVDFYMSPEYWKPILVATNIWKWTGYGSIIYLSTIVGIDESLYEAAIVDGANRFHQIIHITIPMLVPTAIVLVLLHIGRIFYGDFGMIYGIIRDNGMLLNATEIIDTYVFRAMRTTGEFGMATAVGLYQSFMGFVLVFFSNRMARKFGEGTSLF